MSFDCVPPPPKILMDPDYVPDWRIQIKVEFYITGDFDPQEATKKIGLEPTETRRKEEFRLKEFATNEWGITIDYEYSYDPNEGLSKLYHLLKDKEKKIIEYCQQNKLIIGITIVVRSDQGNHPYMGINREFIQFAARLNAEVLFDMYLNSEFV